MTKQYTQIPDLPGGYLLTCDDWLSVIVPDGTTNLCTNPSFETGTTGWTLTSGFGALAQSATYQRYGAYSLRMTPTAGSDDGATSPSMTLAALTPYAASCWFFGTDTRITYSFAVTGASFSRSLIFRATGVWQRIILPFTSGVAGAYNITVMKWNGGTSVTPFYLDGVQMEQKAYATTYCDGDQRGFVPTRADYYWTGTPHASTSVRIAQCRAGGREMKLSAFGFLVLSILGLGMAPSQNVYLPTGFQGGATYQRSIYDQRRFSLLGDMRSDEVGLLQDQANLMDVLRFDLVDPPQPLFLKYRRTAFPNKLLSDECLIPCVIEGGPGNQYDNLHGEKTELRFSQTSLPTIMSSGEIGAVLDYQDSTANVARIAQRSSGGVWSFFGTGANGTVYDMAYGPAGELYVVGNFTTVNGVAHNRIVKINADGSLTAMAGGADGLINGITVTPSGRIYVTGSFATLGTGGGAVAAANIGYYESGAWNAMGTGLNAAGIKITLDRDGLPIVVGSFTTANGVNVNYIAKWTGATFSAYSTGLSAAAYSVSVRSSDGYVFVCGNFTTTSGGGTTLNSVGYWDGSAWNAMGSGFSAPFVPPAYCILVAPNGEVYVTGVLNADGYALQRWNGSQWVPLGTGSYFTEGYRIVFDAAGMLWIGYGYSSSASTGIIRWNGSSFIETDITINGPDAITFAFASAPSGVITIGGGNAGGGGWTGTTRYAGLTTVNNPGDAPAYPVIEITGPGVPLSIRNITTGKEITFAGLTLITGERAYLVLDPTNIQFYSNFRSRLEQHINRGSQEADFYLQGCSPTNTTGANVIALYIAETTSAATSAILHFRPRYQSLQSAVYR